MSYLEKLGQRMALTGSGLCVGLDIRLEKADDAARAFIADVIAQTAPYAAAYKPNSAYFEALGWEGMKLLEETIAMVPGDIPVILDAKRGDIGETQRYYAKACFEVLKADAVTLNPYMGRDTLEPFLDYQDKGLYLLGVTSNAGAADIELQTLQNGGQVFEIVGRMTERHPQAGLVLGLTNATPETLSLIPDVPLLIPGLGAQGGDMEALRGTGRKAPALVNVSRGILYAEPEKTFAEKAAFWAKVIAGQ
jgi:orotidine 5'-phosphate decarboxylase subfamily 2